MFQGFISKRDSRFLAVCVCFILLVASCSSKEKEPSTHQKYEDEGSSMTAPSNYEGVIRDIDIRLDKTADGWNISLKNNLWASTLSVWFDDVYQGAIERANERPEKYVWKTFFSPRPVNRVVVGVVASPYKQDVGRAWYRDLD
jgi:hypothetical protein